MSVNVTSKPLGGAAWKPTLPADVAGMSRALDKAASWMDGFDKAFRQAQREQGAKTGGLAGRLIMHHGGVYELLREYIPGPKYVLGSAVLGQVVMLLSGGLNSLAALSVGAGVVLAAKVAAVGATVYGAHVMQKIDGELDDPAAVTAYLSGLSDSQRASLTAYVEAQLADYRDNQAITDEAADAIRNAVGSSAGATPRDALAARAINLARNIENEPDDFDDRWRGELIQLLKSYTRDDRRAVAQVLHARFFDRDGDCTIDDFDDDSGAMLDRILANVGGIPRVTELDDD